MQPSQSMCTPHAARRHAPHAQLHSSWWAHGHACRPLAFVGVLHAAHRLRLPHVPQQDAGVHTHRHHRGLQRQGRAGQFNLCWRSLVRSEGCGIGSGVLVRQSSHRCHSRRSSPGQPWPPLPSRRPWWRCTARSTSPGRCSTGSRTCPRRPQSAGGRRAAPAATAQRAQRAEVAASC